jgi:predicted nucleic acid-binding protein
LAQFTAFLDACVLYPAPLRDLLMELAVVDLYRAKWSDAVHQEWIAAILQKRTDLTRTQLERTRDLMNMHVRDALVTDFEQLIDILSLPDPDDRHVLAAAIRGRADLIVTTNQKDFPSDVLGRWGIEAQHPDEFLTHQFHLAQPLFLQAVKTVRLRLKDPPKSVEDYLDTLRAQGLLATVNDHLVRAGEQHGRPHHCWTALATGKPSMPHPALLSSPSGHPAVQHGHCAAPSATFASWLSKQMNLGNKPFVRIGRHRKPVAKPRPSRSAKAARTTPA